MSSQQSERDRESAAQFRRAADIAEERGPRDGIDPELHQAMIDTYRQKADELTGERS